MNALPSRLPAASLLLGLAVLGSGCVATSGGYGVAEPVGGIDDYPGAIYSGGFADGYSGGVGFGGGGWDRGFAVAPYREGYGHPGRGSGFRGSHGYRSAPMSHSMPFLPSGGGHGGGHGGGGHGR